MKSSEKIIAHISGKPLFQKIGQKKCFEKVIALLPPHLAKAVMFTYVKNQTLFFVLNHPGLKMEFNYKITLIKSLLKKIKDIDPNCKNMQIHEVKAFVTNKIDFNPPPPPPPSKFTYKERATGRFYNFATNPKLKKLFQEIKEEIKKHAAS